MTVGGNEYTASWRFAMHHRGHTTPGGSRLAQLLGGRGPWIGLSVLLLAALSTPFALAAGESKPLSLGQRNPSGGAQQQLTRETQLIAKTAINTYGTRQSNKGAGGGAIYGCRAKLGSSPAVPKVTTPCMRANNLDNGEAFQFSTSNGSLVGVIQVGNDFAAANPNAKPFITNATGVATGLNADQVDGMHAADIVAAAQATNPAGAAPSFAFARLDATGAVDASRSQGVTSANVSHTAGSGLYCFTGLTSRPKNAEASIDGATPGEITVDTTTNTGCGQTNVQLTVRTFDSAGTAADRAYQVQATGTGG
jgi:hypothetical protein